MWDSAGNSSWSYDEYGRVTTATRVVDGRSYASDYTFDALDRVREMTYPDNETLTYSYQANLLLDGISSSIGDLDLVSDVVYEDIGLPDSYTLGSSPTTATQSFEYWKIDDASRSPFAALKRIKLSKDSTDLVNREMQYDVVGNVTRIVDGVNSETIDYTYDELNRVLTASVPTGESFVYDAIGNLTSKAGAALDYGTTPKHAVKSHGSTTYTYDANGSVTARGTQTIKYDPEQRPILVQDGTSIHRAAYDGDGVRRKRDDDNGTVHYLGGYERKLASGSESSDTVTKYYSASLGAMSRPVAFRRGGTLHWVGADHLGGTIRVLNSSFTALDRMRYRPYGEDRDAGTALVTDRKFTGQTEDEAAGLYWYASRAYDPAIGRFVSPDVVVPDPSNPQSLNRYGYVRNNPLKFVDPSGHSEEWVNKAWRDEFREVHDQNPEDADYAFRYYSMDAASRGEHWSVEHWVRVNYGNTQAPQSPLNYYGDPPPGGVTPATQQAINSYQSEKPYLSEFSESHAQLTESLQSGERELPESFQITSDQVQGTNRSLGFAALERHSALLAERFPRHRHALIIVSKSAKFGGPIVGATIEGVTSYVQKRESGTPEWRALFVTVVDVGLVAAAGVGGSAAGGPVGGMAAGYGASVLVKELQPGDFVADVVEDFLGH